MLLDVEWIKKYGLSSNQLKIIALLIMITDHIGAVLFPQYRILRYIGRLAFPIYCFLIVEGAQHTKNIMRYFFVLLIFGFISEIPFDLAISGRLIEFNDQNVFFSLALGLMVIIILKKFPMSEYANLGLVICCVIAFFGRTDYSIYGIIIIYFFYIFKDKPAAMVVTVSITNVIMGIGGTGSQKYGALSFLIIFLYSGKRARSENGKIEKIRYKKYFFYLMYPIHLLVLYFIKVKLFNS